jgi:hypothetical protein
VITDSVSDGQAEAGPGGLGREERVEDGGVRQEDPRTVVFDFDDDAAARVTATRPAYTVPDYEARRLVSSSTGAFTPGPP